MSAKAKPNTLHTSRPGRRGLAITVAGLLVLAQVLALFHIALQAHSFSPVSGRIIHPAGESGGTRSSEVPTRDSSGEECQIFAAIQQAATLAAPCAGLPGADLPCDRAPASPDPGPLSSPWAIYLIAPSQSPPLPA